MTTEAKKDVILIRGIGVSSGIIIDKAYLVDTGGGEAVKYFHLEAEDVKGEVDRFKGALKESRDQLARIKKRLLKEGKGKEHVRIIDAHSMILKDRMGAQECVEGDNGFLRQDGRRIPQGEELGHRTYRRQDTSQPRGWETGEHFRHRGTFNSYSP
jgi:hypothetical protein